MKRFIKKIARVLGIVLYAVILLVSLPVIAMSCGLLFIPCIMSVLSDGELHLVAGDIISNITNWLNKHLLGI